LKVLHIGKYFPPYSGGMETYLRDVMASLSRLEVEGAALVHQSEIGLKSCEEDFVTEGRCLPVTRAAVWMRLLFTPVSPTFPWLLHRLIKRQKPDILHIHMPNVSAFWALILPSARRIPWVIQWHADVLASKHSHGLRLFYTFYRPLERAMLKRAKKIIASSPPYLDSSPPLQDFRDKCSVIPLGLDPINLSSLPLPDKSPRPGSRENSASLQVLAIGRLTYYKGFDYLLRSVAKLDGVHVHLVGTGDREIALKTLVKDLGANDKVTFHGYLPAEELAQQFAACDCLCLPSIERTEAFGLVLLEAMYFGKATIVSDVPGSGMGWIVESGVTGLKTSPENIDELTTALRLLRENRDKIALLGRNGRRKFDQKFHIDQTTPDIVRLYSHVLGTNLGLSE
jgi:glycosyltransferase involved in cell wall biosynthesis